MPGPGARGKGKAKKPKTASMSPSTSSVSQQEQVSTVYIPEIEHAEGWDAVVSMLCNYFKLPDLSTRSGLKKVHANFSIIYSKLEKAYEQSEDNYKIKGGIVGIAAKMCVDSLLRNKIFGKGILDKILPLLDVDETRHLAMRSLSTITHHGGSSVRCEIAKHASRLTKLMRDLPDDEKVTELGVITLAHSVCAAVEGDSKPHNPQILRSLDMVEILKTVLEAIKRPHRNPRVMIEHALGLLSFSTLHGSNAYKAYPSAINFLIAGMRSNDWATRCSCLGGLLTLHRLEAEDDTRQFDPAGLMGAVQRGVPSHLNDILMEYGPMRSELYLTLSCAGQFQKAMMSCAQTRDLYALGLEQASLILKTEFSIPNGYFEVEGLSGRSKLETSPMGLPFTMWSDSLPHTANAIRAKRKPEEQDLADILDIKYHIIRARIPDAVAQAKKGLQRNPEQAYFYYAITLSADNVNGLRAAKKGLKCKLITPFVKYQMMQRAVEHAGDMGVKLLQDPAHAGEKWEEGIAFLMSALEDAKTYVDEAPPDNRHMKNVGYWYILLSVLTRKELSPDLRELEENLKTLKTADEFSEFIGIRPPKTNLRLAQQAVVNHYGQAIAEFSRVFEVLDGAKETRNLPPFGNGKLEDDLAAWLEDMHLEDGTLEQRMRCEASEDVRKVNFENVELYRCSWCGNPSAGLRKCSGCAKTRYCDSPCQKSHWSSHKKQCQRA